ncbi:polysaccharide biosynthesis C-terminal domain-containing protein [Gemella sp. GH3]|uniref:polysaccharide biosynthesis C-terminal domain-containing protein n=1 Tax=unclassified Gemella TaxID=2624949 RepID=UPI0015CFF2B6|nr:MULTISPECIES: polysaccharide biosynthesis C-terminal domain-containing protein [unclassified Gemella]MBF0713649.1 polysaccharide biosynthesis C-terminal domain-containing protein [Gemella sp. GH3.1]NYS50601.1 polysaccharide biosynthesis C-terminal domain-containing protein [Gemella sp. GH3]
MRTKKAFYNILTTLILQIITIISGFVVNKLFVLYYGSSINGMVGGVNQIISALVLIEAGVGAAATLALYDPLRESNINKINKILGATKSFYYRSGIIYILVILLLVWIYPQFISSQIDTYSVRLIIVILSLGSIIDYFFFGKYRVLLTADQKLYVINIYQGISMLLSMVASIWLIYNGYSYFIVKFVAAVMLFIRFVAVKLYINKNYNVEFSKDFSGINLSQRWGAFVHQIATVVVFNTDVIVITLFGGSTSLLLAGVYVVYNMIYTALSNLVGSITNSLIPSFGDLLLEKDYVKLYNIFSNFEFLVFYIIYFVYTCFTVLLGPFVNVYMQGVTDANYNDGNLVILFSLMAVLQSIRIPSNTMIGASGHYKETQWRAVLEAIINIVFSIVLAGYIGIYGVLIGTIISFLYRSVDMILYNNKYIVKNTLQKTIKRILLNTASMIFIVYIFSKISVSVSSYFDWILYASLISIIVLAYYTLLNYIFEKKEIINIFNLAKSIMHKKRT